MATQTSKLQPTRVSTDAAPDINIDSKIRLYSALGALRRSRLPSNAQINDAISYVKANPPVDEKKLSADGQTLVRDIQDILTTFSTLVNEKNEGEILQRFIWATRGVDASTLKPSEDSTRKGKDGVDNAKRDAQEAAHHLRTLLSLFLSNAEVRKLITDAGTLGRELLSKSAVKLAEKVAPSPEAIRNADDAAPHDQFTESRPVMARSNSATTQDDELTDSDPSDTERIPSRVEPDTEKSSKNRLLSKLQSFHTSKSKPMMEEGKTWFTDEYFPEERREQWIWRGKKVIIECQKHDDYQSSVRWLLDTVDSWAARVRETATTAKDGEQTTAFTQDPQLHTALALFQTLLERIAGASLDQFLAAARVLATDAANDEGLRRWWSSVGSFIRKILLEVGYVTEPASSTKARELRDKGKEYYNGKYKAHFDALLDATAGWFKAFADDAGNQALAEGFTKLTRDLLFDSEGNLQFKGRLWHDVRTVILPALMDKIGYVPIPRVEYSDDNLDVVIENLTLSGRQLFPTTLEMEAHNHVRLSGTKTDSQHEFTFTFADMHSAMRDVAFAYRTKTGIKMRDTGLADVAVGPVRAVVTLKSTAGRDSVFRIANVRVKIASLKLKIRESKHTALYKTFKPLAMGLIKRQIQKAMADSIRTGFEYVDGQLVSVRDRMKDENGGVRKELNNMVKRTKQVRDDADSGKTSASVSTGGSQFRVIASKDKSILPDRGHPTGWVNRVAETEKQVTEVQDDWRSDAFDIAPSNSKPKFFA